MTFAATPEILRIRAAGLDNSGRYEPQIVAYATRGHALVPLDLGNSTAACRQPPAKA